MEALQEEHIVYEKPLFPLRIFINQRPDQYKNPWHFHHQAELLYILSGQMDMYVEQSMFALGPGDVVLVGSMQPHRFISHGVRYYVLQFDCHPFFDPSVQSYLFWFTGPQVFLSRLNYIFAENREAKEIVKESIEKMYKEHKEKASGFELVISMLIRNILVTLLRSDTKQVLLTRFHTDLIRLKPALDYVDSHLTGKVDLKEASRLAKISYYHFARYFKKVMGMSFIDYVNYNKIKLAERILLTEDVSVERIGEIVGIAHMGHFYKTFRKYNQCSPKEYRDRHAEPETASLAEKNGRKRYDDSCESSIV
ncbi:helix-turn-helix domain-containing protein [Paenibacillus allorhizosphaerae]|uniref:HTH-type transcriptional activator RhaS n=1 Tax=Paenibacillus allorhizosphaerae TaxID=2849866 RepID=A0ABM8VH25_9BACL|nr:AraC family transcriptional regulator [Paenibacillus allorhizosphaerae]CAG7640462.1 HTH-type transcriptional activator RhaS [Paenibacillus allorhizosphaerae]